MTASTVAAFLAIFGPGRAGLSYVDVDGSVLEGGGQVIRLSAAVATLLGSPLHVDKIRAGRRTPGLQARGVPPLCLNPVLLP